MLALSLALLLISLLAVVLLAKKFSVVVDVTAALIGAPPAFAGVVVAALILLPEGVTAVAAARGNDLQKSINLALGSSLATIGLTIPAVGVAAYVLDMELVLGLDNPSTVLLALTFFVSMLTFGTGRTNILFGLVHMVVLRYSCSWYSCRNGEVDRCLPPNPTFRSTPPRSGSPSGGWLRAAPPDLISTAWTMSSFR